MAAPDIVTWNEALPDNDTVAHLIDDFDRDLRQGVSARMRREHIWPTTQTATNEAGHHAYISFQSISSGSMAAVMAGTTAGAVYVGSSGAGYPLVFINSAGTGCTLVNSAGNIPIISGGTFGSIAICSSANPFALVALTASAEGYLLTCHTVTGAPTWNAFSEHIAIESGTVAHGATITCPSGYTTAQCYFMVSGLTCGDADHNAARHEDALDGFSYSVTISGVVTAQVKYHETGTVNKSANYMVIGIK